MFKGIFVLTLLICVCCVAAKPKTKRPNRGQSPSNQVVATKKPFFSFPWSSNNKKTSKKPQQQYKPQLYTRPARVVKKTTKAPGALSGFASMVVDQIKEHAADAAGEAIVNGGVGFVQNMMNPSTEAPVEAPIDQPIEEPYPELN